MLEWVIKKELPLFFVRYSFVKWISLFIPTFLGMSDTFDTVIKYSHMGLFTNALSDLDHFKWQDQKASLIALIIWILVFALLDFMQAKKIRKIS